MVTSQWQPVSEIMATYQQVPAAEAHALPIAPQMSTYEEPEDPLSLCKAYALDMLDLTEAHRAQVESHLERTTWPTQFTSIAAMKNSLVDPEWSPEDDAVLRDVPNVVPVDLEKFFAAFFPGKFSKECKQRREKSPRQPDDHVDQINQDAHGSTPEYPHKSAASDECSIEDLHTIRELHVARKEAMQWMQDNGLKATNKDSHLVSFPEMIRVRDFLSKEGWPGRFRDISSYKSDPSPSGRLSQADIYAIYVIRCESPKRTMSTQNIRALFFPTTADAAWEQATSNIKRFRKCAKNEEEELRKAGQEDTLGAFAQKTGKTLYHVKQLWKELNPVPTQRRKKRSASSESVSSPQPKRTKSLHPQQVAATFPPSRPTHEYKTRFASPEDEAFCSFSGEDTVTGWRHTPSPSPFGAVPSSTDWSRSGVPFTASTNPYQTLMAFQLGVQHISQLPLSPAAPFGPSERPSYGANANGLSPLALPHQGYETYNHNPYNAPTRCYPGYMPAVPYNPDMHHEHSLPAYVSPDKQSSEHSFTNSHDQASQDAFSVCPDPAGGSETRSPAEEHGYYGQN